MSNDSWTNEIVVPNSPEEVYDAVTKVREWWSEGVEGRTTDVGDEFTFTDFDDLQCRFRITEATPGRKVVWRVLDSQLSFVEDQHEWTGTEVSFEMTPTPDGTSLRFTHHGLRPTVECYGACSRGWDFYMNRSLKDFITDGRPQPITKPG